MSDSDPNTLTKAQSEEILKILNGLVHKGHWQSSNFLKIIGKNLTAIRDKFETKVNATEQTPSEKARELARQMAAKSGLKEVYIALYSTDGSNLSSWERIVTNLPQQMISRPIYEHEADLKEMIKSKENKINEAYVSIYVNESDILPMSAEKAPQDKLGKHLLTLKDRALQLERISLFSHLGNQYQFIRGKLVPSEEE